MPLVFNCTTGSLSPQIGGCDRALPTTGTMRSTALQSVLTATGTHVHQPISHRCLISRPSSRHPTVRFHGSDSLGSPYTGGHAVSVLRREHNATLDAPCLQASFPRWANGGLMVNNRPQQGPEETSPVVSIVRVSPAPKSTLPITGATGEETGTCSTHPCLLVSVARGHIAPTGGERCTEDELGGGGTGGS